MAASVFVVVEIPIDVGMEVAVDVAEALVVLSVAASTVAANLRRCGRLSFDRSGCDRPCCLVCCDMCPCIRRDQLRFCPLHTRLLW